MRSVYFLLPFAIAERHHGHHKPQTSIKGSRIHQSCDEHCDATSSTARGSSLASLSQARITRDGVRTVPPPAHTMAGKTQPCEFCFATLEGSIDGTPSSSPEPTPSNVGDVTPIPEPGAGTPLTSSAVAPIPTATPVEETTQVATVTSFLTTSWVPLSSPPLYSYTYPPDSPVDECLSTPGGLQDDGSIIPGCGGMLEIIQLCHSSYDPSGDLANYRSNIMFQSCVCKTTHDDPFTPDSVLYKNFTGCANCLMSTKVPTFVYLSAQLEKLTSFCRSQNPFPYDFYLNLNQWILTMQVSAAGHLPSRPPLTGASEYYKYYTTLPPLANVAYGVSAPDHGSLREVSPSLTTFTSQRGDLGPQTVTSLVAWVPTKAGKPYNSNSAAASEFYAASSALSSHLCYGKGPGSCLSTGSSIGGPSWLLLGCCVALTVGLGMHLVFGRIW